MAASVKSGVLFLGIEGTPQNYYRCVLPARTLGCDWLGVTMGFNVLSGEVDGKYGTPDPFGYETVVVQQAAGSDWEERLLRLKRAGIRVVYEIDDYLHGVKDVPEHTFRSFFGLRSNLKAYEQCMELSDALVVSTQFLAERYRKHCPGPTYVCRNGIDPSRFALHRANRKYMTVGIAGATGHVAPLLKWLNGGVLEAVASRPAARFATIGVHTAVAEAVEKVLPGRVSGVPFSAFETYPAAMLEADVLLAPAGGQLWHRGKSDLRWLEASALGIPCVCDARGYPEASLHVSTPAEAAREVAYLLDHPDLAEQTGAADRNRVLETRAFPQAAEAWREPLGL